VPAIVAGIGLHEKQSEVFKAPQRFKVVVAGRRWGKCMHGDTRIAMADGTHRRIAEVRPGDLVLSVNENTYQIEPRPVLAVASNDTRELVRVRTNAREVVCTPHHPFLVNNRWVEAQDMRPGDLAAVPRHLIEPADTQDMSDHELDLLAIWLAEGRSNRVSNATPAVLSRLREAVAAFGCEISQDKHDVTTWRWTGKRNGPGRMSEPSAFLARLGVWGRDSKTKFIPEVVYRLPNDRLARFLNLFMACDGCVARRAGKTWAVEVALANERMVRQLAELFLRFGVRGQIRYERHRKLDRRGQPYESWRFIASDAASVAAFCRGVDSLADGDIAWEEVIEITPAGHAETFDLQIEGNPNFIAEGFVTHNTELAKAKLIRAARKPRQLVWYVAPTYRMAKQIMWVALMDSIPRAWIVKSNETSLEIHLVNKSRICLKGADKPDTLRGVGINYLVLDEMQDIRPEVWNTVLRPTLASTRGHALFVGTPKAYNHLYDLYVKGQKPELQARNEWMSWQFPTITSPFIPVSEIEAARADMDERTFRQEFEATFESMSGRVYYQFSRQEHVGAFPFNPKLPMWIGQDFNVDPMSTVVLQRQLNGEIWAVDEIYLRSSNTNEVCDELERRYWRQFKQITVYPDPAGANRTTKGRGESDLDIFRERGLVRLRYRRKHPPVADRVNAVNKMLRTADGRIRLRVDAKCPHLIESLEQTLYKKGTPEIDKKAGLEHMADALGYPIELQFPRRRFEPAGLSL